jgi:hypothetical protein
MTAKQITNIDLLTVFVLGTGLSLTYRNLTASFLEYDKSVAQITMQSPNVGSTIRGTDNVTRIINPPQTIKAPCENVNADNYFLNVRNITLFDCYLISGFVLDCDRPRAIVSFCTRYGSGDDNDRAEYDQVSALNTELTLSKLGDKYIGQAQLPFLSEGTHNLTAWVRAEQNYMFFGNPFWAAFSDTITFNVDNTSPTVALLSPTSNIDASKALLMFIVNEHSPEIAYSLDGTENTSINGNYTLPKLSTGPHDEKLYVWDATGNVEPSETTFIINPSTATPTPMATPAKTIETPSPILLSPTDLPAKPQPKVSMLIILMIATVTVLLISAAVAVWIKRINKSGVKT